MAGSLLADLVVGCEKHMPKAQQMQIAVPLTVVNEAVDQDLRPFSEAFGTEMSHVTTNCKKSVAQVWLGSRNQE